MKAIGFRPWYMTRVWGGRELERVYGRELPDDQPYGESWELVDREKEQSVVAWGEHEGRTLHELWTERRREVFGDGGWRDERFPILIKILDARDDLSIQVHPPQAVAGELGGEPKTEMWYLAAVDEGAKLYVGLKKGVDRERFERAIAEGSVAECVHAIEPRAGESIFIESGRLHAIGAGFLIHEIQQNSDTTYRVFDWNRMGLDGKPRELHVEASMRSIDFGDIEPGMDEEKEGVLASCEHFRVERRSFAAGEEIAPSRAGRFAVVSVIRGALETEGRRAGPGDLLLLPVATEGLQATEEGELLEITLPDGR